MKENGKISKHKIIQGNCLDILSKDSFTEKIDLTFLDPPFNQNKDYSYFNDNLPPEKYWELMGKVCEGIYSNSKSGAALYFMQREKNTEFVLKCLRETGWTLQNTIVWKKKTSAVPCSTKYGIHYQIIAFATKGSPRIFNRLRISPPLLANYKYERDNGVYVTDVWDDIRELTSGYFAGNEALRKSNGERLHKQQTPIALLLRIILSSSKPGDIVFDPFAGTGTTLVVSEQLERKSIGIEIDPENVKCIKNRVKVIRDADNIEKYYKDYVQTSNLNDIWNIKSNIQIVRKRKSETLKLFEG